MAPTLSIADGPDFEITSTEFTALIVDLDSAFTGQSYPIDVYFSQGASLPIGGLPDAPATAITPRIVDMSTNLGSIAGSRIYANVQGVGPADSENIMLILTYGGFPPDQDLCDEVTVVRNGLVSCFTKPGVWEPQGPFAVKPTVRVKDISSGPGGGTTYGCGGTPVFPVDCPDYLTFELGAAQPRVETTETELLVEHP